MFDLLHFVSRKIFDYDSYRNFVISLAENKSTTGDQTPERIEATKLNAVRMNRIEKQVVIRKDLEELVRKVKSKWGWVILAEPWCGDGAQNIPVIEKISSLNPNIKLEIILRDENLEFMDKYLTNGARSIPKLICANSESGKEKGAWGARPKKIQDMVLEYKAKNPGVSHEEFIKNLHLWYARDKGESLQEDFLKLIPEWNK